EKGPRLLDLGAGRTPVRGRRAGMRRHDVPEEDALLEPELFEDAVHDRRARLRGAAAGGLALGGERDPGEARAAVAARLADEHQRRVGAVAEVGEQPLT